MGFGARKVGEKCKSNVESYIFKHFRTFEPNMNFFVLTIFFDLTLLTFILQNMPTKLFLDILKI